MVSRSGFAVTDFRTGPRCILATGFNQNNLDPNIEPLGLTHAEKNGLVALMIAMTDDRVRHQAAPFDHPVGEQGHRDVYQGNASLVTPSRVLWHHGYRN